MLRIHVTYYCCKRVPEISNSFVDQVLDLHKHHQTASSVMCFHWGRYSFELQYEKGLFTFSFQKNQSENG